MKLYALWKNRQLYSKLLISITLCIVLTLLVSTFVYYSYYIRVEKRQAFQSDLGNLTQTSREVANMTETAESLSFQIYRNSTISKLMFYAKPGIYDLTAAMSELSNYVNSMPYIESIYVYNPNSDVLYIASSRGQNGLIGKEELADTDILRVLDNFQDYRPFTPIPRTYDIMTGSIRQISAYTYLIYDAIGWNSAINSAVIVNLSASWINKEIAGGPGGKSYILDDRKRLLSGETLAAESLDPSERKLIENRVIDRNSGYFVAPFGGRDSLVSYTSPDKLGWQYIRITPYENVTAQTDTIRNATLYIAAAILIAGLIVSWVLSRKLYTPIGRIVSQMNKLETDKRNDMYTIRQNTLRNLVLGVKPLRTNEQIEKLRQLGIVFNFNEDYRLVLLRIDDYAQLKDIRGADLLPYKFAIMNIASEVGSQTYRVETVDMDDDSVLILLNLLDPAEHTDTGLLETLLRQMQEACREYLKIGLSVTYSPVDRQPGQLHPLYDQLKEASRHRLFYGHGSIIDAQSIAARRNKTYVYPADKEKKLTDALMSGKAEEAKQTFSDIVRQTEHYPFHVVRLALSRLTVTVKSIVDNIQKRNGLPIEDGPDVPTLDSFETIERLEEAFFTLLDDILSKLAEKRSTKQDDLVRRINDIIAQSFADPNLSINQIADEFDMSPIYLSRLYKQQTMNAIVDVILEVRMRRACELLERTDQSVAAIAEQTGFTSSSYFHRMFKRTFGVTPTDYRRS